MPPTWPEDDYLLKLGKVIYSISSIEGLLIFDLPRMPEPVEGLTPQDLAGHTTSTTTGNRLISGATLSSILPGGPTSTEEGERSLLSARSETQFFMLAQRPSKAVSGSTAGA